MIPSQFCEFQRISNIPNNFLFVVTLENRFFWLFLQALYCKNEKQKHNFFFFNENYGNKGLNWLRKWALQAIADGKLQL